MFTGASEAVVIRCANQGQAVLRGEIICARADAATYPMQRFKKNSLVVGVCSDEVAHPSGHGGDLARGALLDELQVLLHRAVRVRVHVHARQVRLDQRDQPREYAGLPHKCNFFL